MVGSLAPFFVYRHKKGMVIMYETTPLCDLATELGEAVETGLTENEAKERLEKIGRNALSEAKRVSVFKHIICSFKDVTIIILCVAAAMSLYIALAAHDNDFTESIVIAFIIALNIFLSVREQVKAEKSVDSLKKYNIQKCTVLRNGKKKRIETELLVPGDVIILNAGDRVPADARILEEAGLCADESLLTGESEPAAKDAGFIPEKDTATADSKHMVFSGSLIVAGKCRALVCRTGNETEIGRISKLLENEKTKLSPLQLRMQKLGKTLSIVAFGGALLALLIGWLYGSPVPDMLMVAVSVAVAAIPEVMPVVVTIALSYGVGSMARKNTIVRTPAAVETIGNVSVICSDKTGTLTQNKMSVRRLWASACDPVDAKDNFGEEEKALLTLFLLSSGEGKASENKLGNPTELAIARIAEEKFPNLACELGKYRRIHEIPFDSSRKLMTVVYRSDTGYLSVTKGAVDRIPLKPDDIMRKKIMTIHDSFASDALRVIGVAFKEFDVKPDLTQEILENGLIFAGLAGIIDPPRAESADAVRTAREAGIKTVMITGDHLTTAKAIAEQIGILYDDKKIMNGADMRSISDERLSEIIEDYRVFARTTPEDKIRIVKAFRRAGEVVAMTGDGVNDAPALKAADVGIAMGSGTDVAKEAADMILLDDNFSTIVTAVEEGRRVYSNIRKSLYSMLGCNFSAITIVLFSLIFGWGSPVSALQLLIIKVACDGIPGFSLCVEKADPDIMKQPPVRKCSSIFSEGLISKIIQLSVVFTVSTLIPVWVGRNCYLGSGIRPGFDVARTMTFLVMGLTTVVHVYNCRSSFSVFRRGGGINRLVVGTTIFGAAVMVLVATIPPVAEIFGLVPLGVWHWAIVIALSLSPLLYVEIMKLTGHFKK